MSGAIEIKNRCVGLAQWNPDTSNVMVRGNIARVTETAAGLYDVVLSGPERWDTNDPRENTILPYATLFFGGVADEFIQVTQLVDGLTLKVVTASGGNPVSQFGALLIFKLPTID